MRQWWRRMETGRYHIHGMPSTSQKRACMVYIPVPDRKTADTLAGAAIHERLAGCANVLGPMRSMYLWKGAVKREREFLLLLKTTERRVATLEARMAELHPYECPCIARIDLQRVHTPYLKWLVNSVR